MNKLFTKQKYWLTSITQLIIYLQTFLMLLKIILYQDKAFTWKAWKIKINSPVNHKSHSKFQNDYMKMSVIIESKHTAYLC